MANYFVDSTTGDDGDNGTTMDLAWATLDYAAAQTFSAGDIIWVRRVHSEAPSSNIDPVSTGLNSEDFRAIIGWPRAANSSITSATFTQGSTTVDDIVGLSMDREQHLGRNITGPDGLEYMITKIVDSNTILIQKNYFGSSKSGAEGAFTIHADEDYDLAQAIDDSGWTITKSDYNSDAEDLPQLDFSATAYGLYFNGKRRWRIANLDILDGTWSGYGSLLVSANFEQFLARGILIHQTNNTNTFYVAGNGAAFFERCIVTGDNTGSQQGASINASVYFKHCAFYGCSYTQLSLNSIGIIYLEDVNVGVEEAAGSQADINITAPGGWIRGRDIMFGESGTYGALNVNYWDGFQVPLVAFENYNRQLGDHRTFNAHGNLRNLLVHGGAGDPEKRPGGADQVIEVAYNDNVLAYNTSDPLHYGITTPVFTHEFEVNTEPKTYRYYVQAEGTVSADRLYLRAEYVSNYQSNARYDITNVVSDESITVRSGADDWSQYIEVTVQPVAFGLSKVRIKCYCSYYHASNKIYIDPNPEIT
jgi:hypothetical protein